MTIADHRPVLEVKKLGKIWRRRRGLLAKAQDFVALKEISFEVARGEILAIVGESGCGKSTLARILMGLTAPSSGWVINRMARLDDGTRRQRRLSQRYIQMVFQDPYSSLNPRRRVADIIAEPLRNFAIVPRAEIPAEVARLLQIVGLDPAAGARFPHAFSGGQRQRIAIARALASRPDLLICDEAVSALDVSVKAQIVNLLLDINHSQSLSLIFISHDMGIVEYIADRVLVMQAGEIVEQGPIAEVFQNPRSTYTRTLLAAVPPLAELQNRKTLQ